MRVGMSNQKVGYVQIKNLVQRSSKIYWDEKACEEAKLADIDEERVNWFLKEAKHRRGLDIDENTYPLQKAWYFDRIYRIYRMLTLRYILSIL